MPGTPVADGGGARRCPHRAAARRPAHRRPTSRGAGWRTRLEIAILIGPGSARLHRLRHLPGRAWRRTTASSAGTGTDPPIDFVGLRNYVVDPHRPGLPRGARHNVFIVVMSLVMQGPIALGLALLLNRKMRGQSVIRVLIFVPYVISEVVVGIGWSLMLQSNGALNGLLEKIGLGAPRHRLAVRPVDRDLDADGDHHLEVHRLRRDPVPRRAPGHPRRAHRGRRDRRRLLLADPAPHHAAAARTRRSASGRSCRSSARSSCSISSTSSGASTWPPPPARPRWRPTWWPTAATPRSYGYGNAVAVVMFLISLVVALLYQRFLLRRDTAGAITGGKV